MNRLERLIAIIINLHAKKPVTTHTLAQKFGISQRTVFRDIRTLAEAGLPLYYSAGEGYRLVEGHTLPPIVFAEKEANALLTAEKIIEKNSDGSLISAYRTAMDKVRSVMKNIDREKMDLLQQRVAPSTSHDIIKSRYLTEIQLAITHQIQLQITYRAIYNQEISERKVDPLGLYFTSEHWVMVAYCHLRQDLREFRIDQIWNLKDNRQTFDREFDLQKYFEKIANQ